MATRASIILRAKRESTYQTVEAYDELFEGWVRDAILAHCPAYVSSDTIPDKEERPLTLLVRIELCLARAASFSKQSNNTSSSGFGSDRNTPFQKCMDLATSLRSAYDLCRADLATTGNSSVVMSQAYIDDPMLDVIMDSTYLDRDTISISSREIRETAVDIDVDYTSTAGIAKVYLYVSASPGIYDPSRVNNDDGVKYHSAAAVQATTAERPSTIFRVSDLTTGSTYYFVVVAYLLSGTYRYSNELAVVPAA